MRRHSAALMLTGTPLHHPPEKLHCCQRCQSLQEDQQLRGTDGSGGLSPRSGRGLDAAARWPGLRPHSPEGQSRWPDPRVGWPGQGCARLGGSGLPTPPHSDRFPMRAASDVAGIHPVNASPDRLRPLSHRPDATGLLFPPQLPLWNCWPGDPAWPHPGTPGLSLRSAEVGGLGSQGVGLLRLWTGGSWWGRKATKSIPEAQLPGDRAGFVKEAPHAPPASLHPADKA